MWIVKYRKQIIHAGVSFKLAYRMAKTFNGNLTYKPHASSYTRSLWN
jgi:hypothetical protein